MISKRQFLQNSLVSGMTAMGFPARASDPWGAELAYPSGWGPNGQIPKWEAYTEYRVGNYSGGFEQMFKHRIIERGEHVSPLVEDLKDLRYRWGVEQRGKEKATGRK